jgi:hypothetical protein
MEKNDGRDLKLEEIETMYKLLQNALAEEPAKLRAAVGLLNVIEGLAYGEGKTAEQYMKEKGEQGLYNEFVLLRQRGLSHLFGPGALPAIFDSLNPANPNSYAARIAGIEKYFVVPTKGVVGAMKLVPDQGPKETDSAAVTRVNEDYFGVIIEKPAGNTE